MYHIVNGGSSLSIAVLTWNISGSVGLGGAIGETDGGDGHLLNVILNLLLYVEW